MELNLGLLKLDLGGLLTLLFTIVIVIVFLLIKSKRPKDIKPFVRELKDYTSFTWLILIGAGVIGLWLSVRVAGLYAWRYLFEDKYPYTPYEILTIVAYALATNLCFTFAETLKGQKEEKIRRTIEVTIQAVLVSVITFLNVYRDQREASLFQNIGAVGFAAILIALTITVLLLLTARKCLTKE